MVGTFSTAAVFNLLYLQTQELYHTSVRNSALGICSFTAHVGAFAAGPVPLLIGPQATLLAVAAILAIATPLAW